ncbi:hypothetical protein A3K55_01490 [Candidatus Shapirobacteria bacterium RBG_13_44_7]|uniref:DNA polymerase III delta N-terminal domain-containing protein n=1 Tax=Candidatus Shapirobacteria bacterium RBG_13_44_7 TaxID=1802149 RepID=A0A1F7SKE3_9BACT|nr:MAG: hypothetical protein A3K55_01490 [Candidatus Shapirobacteria bacterium RBG_13_44_7]
MIFIFHGNNQKASLEALNLQIGQDQESLRLDSKSIDLNQINNFLHGPSLFPNQKTLRFDNFFSIPKATQNKLIPLLLDSQINIYLWQDKALTPAQTKTFPQAQVQSFRLDNQIFKCLYSIKPKNLKYFLTLYHQIIDAEYYDLFLYLLKGHLRKLLLTSSALNLQLLRQSYLRLVELDFQNKNGRLTLPREVALEQILITLIE